MKTRIALLLLLLSSPWVTPAEPAKTEADCILQSGVSAGEGILIEFTAAGDFLVDSGKTLKDLRALEAFLKEVSKTFLPRLIVPGRIYTLDEYKRLHEAIFLLQKNCRGFSVLLAQS